MIFYVLNVALILAGCLVFYKLLLQKETFFPLNRFVLLICLTLSFGLPLVPVPQQWSFRKSKIETLFPEKTPLSALKTDKNLPNADKAPLDTNSAKERTDDNTFFKDISPLKTMQWIYWLGVVVFGINFLFQLGVLLYRAYSRPMIGDGRFRIIELSGDQAPCSFGNTIFINPEKYDWDTYNQIIIHEKIHIQQGHSYDILLVEFALVFQWFNPFAWMYRKAMEDNLEFLTDNEMLAHSDIEPESYQMNLVKVSVPHFPVSLTTNYNQSILKKRLVMMNAKKSNVNSTWKYLFILPLLMVFMAFLNEPVAYAKNGGQFSGKNNPFETMESEGDWFATIKGDKVNVNFTSDGDNDSKNTQTFSLKDFKSLPANTEGTFSVSRDAGSMVFTGKFEGNTGRGRYKFNTNAEFKNFMDKEGVVGLKEKDFLVFFLINVKKDYVRTLKDMGYKQISKEELIPLVALNVNTEYIKALKAAGIEGLTLQQLIPLKALNVDAQFVEGVKSSGYKKITADRLVTLKANGINGEYLKNVKEAEAENRKVAEVETKATVNKLKETKKIKVSTGEDDELGNLIARKVMNVTPEYAQSFINMGLKVSDDNLFAFRSLGVTPEFFESFKAAGIKVTDEQLISFRSLGITASDFSDFKKLGFKNLSIDDVISARATGTSPSFINSMKKKGHNYDSIEDYIKMKVLSIE